MSREEGFAVMDVSTSVCDDPKFRRLAREFPEHVASAFVAYVATMAESWRTGKRATVVDAWPSIIPYVPDAVTSMLRVGLLDKGGRIPSKAWAGWFSVAADRRRKARERWARYNAQRDAATASVPRGSDAGTATSVPPVPSSSPSVPPVRPARANGATGEAHKAPTTKRGGPPTRLADELGTLKERAGWEPTPITGGKAS